MPIDSPPSLLRKARDYSGWTLDELMAEGRSMRSRRPSVPITTSPPFTARPEPEAIGDGVSTPSNRDGAGGPANTPHGTRTPAEAVEAPGTPVGKKMDCRAPERKAPATIPQLPAVPKRRPRTWPEDRRRQREQRG